MDDTAVDRLLFIIDEIAKSYDKLRKFETEDFTKEDLEKELRHIRDVAGDIPSSFTKWLKEYPTNLPMIKDFIQVFKPPFQQAIHMQLLLFTTSQNVDSNWLKVQLAMAMGYLNGDGWIDGIKAIRTFLRAN